MNGTGRQSARHPDSTGGLFVVETKAVRTERTRAPVRVAGRRSSGHGEQCDDGPVQGNCWAMQGAASPSRNGEALARDW